MTVQSPPDRFAWPPPASPPRPVPPGSPGGILLRAAAMALPHQAAHGAPPAPSASAFPPRSRRPPLLAPAAPAVAAEALRKHLVPPAAAPAASPSTPPLSAAPAGRAFSAPAPPSSAAPAGRVFSAQAPPSAGGLHPIADKAPFVSGAALAVSKQGLPMRSARRGIGTVATSICSNASLADTNLYHGLGGSSKTMALQHRGAYGEPPASTPPRAPATMPLPHRVLHRPSTRTPAPHHLFSPPEEQRRLFSPNTPLARASASEEEGPPGMYPGASSSSSPPPARRPPHHVADKVVPFVSEAALLPRPGAAGPAALDLPPACLPRPARRGLGTISVGNSFLDDVHSSTLRICDDKDLSDKMPGFTPIPSQMIFPVDDKGARMSFVQCFGDSKQVCHVVGQRYSKNLNDKQRTNVLRATYKLSMKRLKGKMVTSHLSTISEIFARLAGKPNMVNPKQNMSAGAPPPSMLSRSKELAIQYPRTKTVVAETMGDDDEYYFDAANFTKGEHDESATENTCPPSEHRMASKVNIQFCQLKFPISPSCDTTAWDLVLSVLLEHNIRTKDFYLMLNGKPLDGNTMMKDILLFEEQTIHVCPRLRGGVDSINTHSSYPSVYERIDVLMDDNKEKLHRTVLIEDSMRGIAESEAPFLSDISQRLLHGVLSYILSGGHIGRKICWEGRFTLQDIWMSEDGHVRMSPTIVPVEYYPGGGEADYERLYDIVLLFVNREKERYPVHLDHLLSLLRNATEKLRVKPQFVMFVVNHPSLLNYAEKDKLYYLVQHLLKNLSADDSTKVSDWLLRNDGGYHFWSTHAKAAAFSEVYWYKTANKTKPSRYQDEGLRLCFQFGRNYIAHPPTDDLALVEESLSYTFHVLLTTVIESLVRKLKDQVLDENGDLTVNASATRLTEILSNPKADPAFMRCFWDEERRIGGISGADGVSGRSKIQYGFFLLGFFLLSLFLFFLFIWRSWPLGGI